MTKKVEEKVVAEKPSIEQLEKALAHFMKEYIQIQAYIEMEKDMLESESVDSAYDSEMKFYGQDNFGDPEGETEEQALQRRQIAFIYARRNNRPLEACYKSNLAMHKVTELLGYKFMCEIMHKHGVKDK